MKKKWLYQMIYSIIPIFIVVIFVISILFYFAIRSMTSQEIMQANATFTRQVIQTIDNRLKQVDQKLIQEIQNNNVFKLYFEEDNAFNNAQVNSELKKWMLLYPEINNIYVYRELDGMIISPEVMLPLDRYKNKDDFWEQYANRQLSAKWSGLRQISSISNPYKQEVVTLVRQYPLIAAMKGLVVVNVNAKFLQKTIDEMSDLQVNAVQIADESANPLTSRLDAKKYDLSTEIRSDYTGWTYSAGTQRAPFHTFKLIGFWIAGGIFAVLAGFVGILYSVRRSYTPIGQILNHIRKHAANAKDSRSEEPDENEFIFIEKAFDNLIDSTKNYREQIVLLQSYQQSKLFHLMLEGGYFSDKSKLNAELGLRPDASYVVIILEIDNYADFCKGHNHNEQNMQRLSLINGINEILDLHRLEARMEWFDDHRLVALVYSSLRNDLKELERLTEQVFHQMLIWIKINLKFTATIGVGGLIQGTADIPSSFDGALESLQYKLSMGSDQLIYHKHIASRGRFVLQDVIHSISSIAVSMRFGKNDWMDQVDLLFRFFRDHKMSRDETGHLLRFLQYSIEKELLELPEDYPRQWRFEAVPALERAMKESDNLHHLNGHYQSILAKHAATIRMYQERRMHSDLIATIRKDIEMHYADPNMSLNFLGDKYNVNVKYLSQQFKQHFGENFIDVLTRLRITKAKQLLMESDETIQEVGAKVGYTNYLTFYRAFKKITFLTPGDYRDNKPQAGGISGE